VADAEMSQSAIASAYFSRLDGGDPTLMDLFDDDLLLYFPKFGVARGKEAFGAFAAGIMPTLSAVQHFIDPDAFAIAGDRVVVEGTTRGAMANGAQWAGGETPGGRFCNVFEIRDGRIARLFIYLDPDYAGADTERFLWPERAAGPW
jgi:ketosteroid isomerase-like protein